MQNNLRGERTYLSVFLFQVRPTHLEARDTAVQSHAPMFLFNDVPQALFSFALRPYGNIVIDTRGSMKTFIKSRNSGQYDLPQDDREFHQYYHKTAQI